MSKANTYFPNEFDSILEEMKNQKPIIMHTMISISQDNYDELVRNSEKLRLLENAISGMKGYVEIEPLKKIFGLTEDKENE